MRLSRSLIIMCLQFILLAYPVVASDNAEGKKLAVRNSVESFENLDSTAIDIYYQPEALSKEKVLHFFLDARGLIRTKKYPTNFKLKLYKYQGGEERVLKVLNKNIKSAINAEKAIFLTDLSLVEDLEEVYLELYDTDDNIFGTYRLVPDFESDASVTFVDTQALSCDYTVDLDCLLRLIVEKINFSASYGNTLITEVTRLGSGNYSVVIPVKKGRRLTNKVKKFKFKGGGKKGGSSDGYYPYLSGETELAFSQWNDENSSISFSTLSRDDVFQIFSNNTVSVRTDNNTGLFNIGASSDGTPNIVFEAGDLSTTPIDGALEFDGSNLYFTAQGSRIALGSGGVGPQGPAGPTGPTGPAGPAGGGVIDLSNGGNLNGTVVFLPSGILQDAFVNGSFQYIDGNQATGRVLTSDVNGNATWQAVSSGPGASGVAGSVQFSDGSNGLSSDAANFFWEIANGELGIGTNDPGAALDVRGFALIGDPAAFVTAIGSNAAASNTGFVLNAIGFGAAQNNMGIIVDAIGSGAAFTNNGNYVVAIGNNAAATNNGHYINALGVGAAGNNEGYYVNALGASAANRNTADNVNAIGNTAGLDNTGEDVNLFGYFAGRRNYGSDVNAMGRQAAIFNDGNNVDAFGEFAAQYNNGDGVVAIGRRALYVNEGNYNIAIGHEAGDALDTGSENVLIGHSVEAPDVDDDYQLNIGNTIYGDLANGEIALGITTSHPAATLELNGTFLYRDGNQAAGMVLTSDAAGNATWQAVEVNGAASYWNLDSNVVSNTGSSADEVVDDFVFGSDSLDDDGIASHDQRMFFDKDRYVFRAGEVTGSQWNTASLGNGSVAFGRNTIANGEHAMAWGSDSFGLPVIASGDDATAWGSDAIAAGDYSTAWGVSSFASGYASTAWAQGAAAGLSSTAWAGANITSTGTTSTAWGSNVTVSAADATAFGEDLTLSAANAVLIGKGNGVGDRLVNSTANSLSVGFNSNAATLYVGPASGGSTTGNVGIGTTSPARKLHISAAMRLEPQATAPAGASTGDLYVDSSGSQALCIYLNGAWVVAAGAGSCI